MAEGPLAEKLSFVSRGAPRDTFSVLSFEGREGLCELYEFTAELASTEKDLDLRSIMSSEASLTVSKQDEERSFNGVLSSFAELHEANGLYFYRATLRPRLWRLSLTSSDRVFVNQTVPEILRQTLTDGGLADDGFEFRFRDAPEPRDYVCRYGESLYDFFLRWLTRCGMYYFFEQGQDGEKLVVTDTLLAHTDAPGAETLAYAPVSGLDSAHLGETVRDFSVRRVLTPAGVALKDYNYRKPGLDLAVQADVGVKGVGETYFYGDHYRTPDEGKKLAKIRAEAFAASSRMFSGSSYCPGFTPGCTFNLTRHFEDALNGKYLAVTVSHQGYAARAGAAGLGPATPGEGRGRYENSFTAIEAGTQYRPPQADRAAIAGVMPARVDAAGSGQYAELDGEGRYRVVLPFDQSGLSDGKASAPVRMLTPYGGDGFGMHCPLHKGAEAALGYVDGNPDRPVILGAAPNPENKSPVTTDSQTQCRLTTASGNKLHFEDQEGNQRILLQSATGDFMRIGSHNDPVTDSWVDALKNAGESVASGLEKYFNSKGIALYAPDNHWIKITAQNSLTMILGENMKNILGFYMGNSGANVEVTVGLAMAISLSQTSKADSFREAIQGVRTFFNPQNTVLQGTGQQLNSDDIEVTQNTLKTSISRTKATMSQVALSQQTTRLAGRKANATQEKFQAAQDTTLLAGQRMQAEQNVVQTAMTRQQLAGQRVLLAQDHIEAVSDSTSVFASATRTAGDRLAATEIKVSTAAEELTTAGIYSKA